MGCFKNGVVEELRGGVDNLLVNQERAHRTDNLASLTRVVGDGGGRPSRAALITADKTRVLALAARIGKMHRLVTNDTGDRSDIGFRNLCPSAYLIQH